MSLLLVFRRFGLAASLTLLGRFSFLFSSPAPSAPTSFRGLRFFLPPSACSSASWPLSSKASTHYFTKLSFCFLGFLVPLPLPFFFFFDLPSSESSSATSDTSLSSPSSFWNSESSSPTIKLSTFFSYSLRVLFLTYLTYTTTISPSFVICTLTGRL